MIYRYEEFEQHVASGRITRAEGDAVHAYARWLRSGSPIAEFPDDEGAIAELAAAEHAAPGGPL